ncbi:conserved hypothetical protein [Buchnera aphidicola str. Bp (Baizongia pistaciae)]|uniref:Dual-specificity RNA methyltransferase RlmN n=1 Tax=Buchnera aphidicola subsp. Baizongia pistaciae (strain Bp) TaxID=224915 RepID=RLMN_BUCBP|nr:bifunctional tRNA (adenosine(37)-C2)-methyltransferase TrmG/ribosomal RNA large subunit methyltransferase RlmN [Buchnera aphidicola]Q89AK8.1 RecName: Full=Dual-specificity RNA methyltransferase RlmN; AltName: Full=23S rRNA (adenine(2503)-C(2))-methyltransferase; AltName: Full=23S rRNA m2A2503 methyltransferase; AltName: Full=Ribosomal RNA large subunit methyltransferase N; AltName: Full=tRNA (adenine(37)-C(2))-methyltransferase; AltName: Full=tRNA m2A37 methyltransferase [Buchnera aphidicola st
MNMINYECKMQKIKLKTNLLNFDLQSMKKFFCSIGELEFRAQQVMKWIYQHYCDDFNKMTNISLQLRKKLSTLCCITPPKFLNHKVSVDGTMKWSVVIGNQCIETVCIPKNQRTTLCISSQLGCSLACSFCLTGQQGFNKNLNVSEIIGQVWYIQKLIYFSKINITNKITNVVLMGMGEPLLNLSNVVHALRIMLDEFGLNMSKNHITLSTAGIVPALKKLHTMIDVSLAVSLHASNNTIRNQLMPINKKYNIESVLCAIKKYLYYSNANKKRVTIEYVMLSGINDAAYHAEELFNLLKSIPHKINLIPWNHFSGSNYICSNDITINNFANILIKKGCIVTIRKIRGYDINAACGQLSGIVFDRKFNKINCIS